MCFGRLLDQRVKIPARMPLPSTASSKCHPQLLAAIAGRYLDVSKCPLLSPGEACKNKKVENPPAYKTSKNILAFNCCDLIKICKYVRMSKRYTQCQLKQEDDTAPSLC